MFGLCQDEFTKEIHKRGYSLVALPEASIKPLQVLGRDGRTLSHYGEVAGIFQAGHASLPEVKPETHVAPIDVTSTSALDNRLGLSIVSKWLGGDKVGLAGRLKQSSRFRLKLTNVTKEAVDLAPLDRFLTGASLHGEMPAMERLLDSDNLYITTAVLKSPSLILESASGDLVNTNFDVPDVGYGVSGAAKVSVDGKNASRVVFKADTPVVFAFQAVRTYFDNGGYVSLHPDRQLLVLKTDQEGPSGPRETGWLSDQMGPQFVRFSG